ncbi:MAG: apolipoprotein N-acyltransferase [Armatimonadia bacterium]
MTQQVLPEPPASRSYILTGFVVAAALAALAAFPPTQVSGLGWFALLPLILALTQMPPRRAFWHGCLFGLIYMAGIMSFVGKYGFAPWLALAAAMALLYGVFGLVTSLLGTAWPLPRVFGIAAAWTLVEMARGHAGSIAFTFGDLAYSQYLQLPFIQIAGFFGHYGVGFLMALLAAGMATTGLAMLPSTWHRPGPLPLFNKHAGRVGVLCFMLVFANYFYGLYLLTVVERGPKEQPQIKVAAIQALGAPAPAGEHYSTQEALDAYMAESRKATGADLIVWPETAIVQPINLDKSLLRQVQGLARNQKANLLIGTGEESDDCIFNSAWYIRPDGQVGGIYHKMDLVVFGEYVPFRDKCKFFERYPIRDFDYTAGSSRRVFDTGRYRFAPLICFEGIFPSPSREVAWLGADLIVILTSDEWARNTNEVKHHSNMDVFRAIESRKYVVRAATNGRSAIFDPYGQVLAKTGLYQNGSAVASITPRPKLSPYHRWGDWPLLFYCLFALFMGLRLRRRG